MYQYPKQTQPKNNNLTIIVCLVITFLALAFAWGQHEDATMAKFAAANDCKWSYNGTYYWDDRDYTCK